MIKVTIGVLPKDEDFLEELLWAQGALSVSSLPQHVKQRVLEVLFETVDLAVLKSRLCEHLPDLGEIAEEGVEERAWEESWRQNFKPLKVGGFTLIGEWESEQSTDPKMVRIYPGTAFGTGQHETTQLIIEHLEAMDLKGKKVLDAGCGTGILSIVAERLGAADVFGFDFDPDCAENMEHHLRINGSTRTRLRIGVLEDFPASPCDVVVANITINVLRELWPKLDPWLADGGVLLSSGILTEQRKEAEVHLVANGFRLVSETSKGEWMLIEARKA